MSLRMARRSSPPSRDVDLVRVGRALPVRRIRSRAGQRHYPGLFWSATTGGHVPYESRLELDRLWLADFDPDVSWIAAQPMWIVGRDGDTLRRHAPDLLLSEKRPGRPCWWMSSQRRSPLEPGVRRRCSPGRRGCVLRVGCRTRCGLGADLVRLSNVRMLAAGRRLRGRMRRRVAAREFERRRPQGCPLIEISGAPFVLQRYGGQVRLADPGDVVGGRLVGVPGYSVERRVDRHCPRALTQ